MHLAEYFEKTAGRGVLATANADGKVDVAYYARPHVIDSETLAFIMNDRRSHANIIENPSAAYLFTALPTETDSSLNGVRLYLTMIEEERDTERLYKLKRRAVNNSDETRYLVFFHVDTIRPLIGDDNLLVGTAISG
ncbi:MAG: pyridoxamine 5'-phosphate oxidase family protein [Candidatus Latescibacteria bacterium]|nr:pyridoxamine 5'-phosphate oxidase family protein [Candidatus Latescibacterota bacterium]